MRHLFKILLISCSFFWSQVGIAQQDSLKNEVITTNDSTQQIIENVSPTTPETTKKRRFIKRFLKDDYPSPRKAIILTGVFPGLGQIYNKKHWYLKLPVIYGAFGGLIYSISYNTRQFRHFRDEYKLLVGEDPSLSIYSHVNPALVKNARDQHDKWNQMSYIGIGLAYILTAAEAYTTAHLLSFDVSDDLSMQFRPELDFLPEHGTVMGFGIRLKIGRPKPKTHFKYFFEN